MLALLSDMPNPHVGREVFQAEARAGVRPVSWGRPGEMQVDPVGVLSLPCHLEVQGCHHPAL